MQQISQIQENSNGFTKSFYRFEIKKKHSPDITLALIRINDLIQWDNKLDVIIGLIRGQRFYRQEHTNASELHVVRAAYFPSAMAEGRQGSARELLGRVVENCDGGGGRSERARHVVQPISKTVACHISSHRTGI